MLMCVYCVLKLRVFEELDFFHAIRDVYVFFAGISDPPPLRPIVQTMAASVGFRPERRH